MLNEIVHETADGSCSRKTRGPLTGWSCGAVNEFHEHVTETRTWKSSTMRQNNEARWMKIFIEFTDDFSTLFQTAFEENDLRASLPYLPFVFCSLTTTR